MNAKNRVPWIVAAAAMLFAMIVLVRNEIIPEPNQPYAMSRQTHPVIQEVEPEWRPATRRPGTTPPSGDYSPWKASANTPAPLQLPVATPAPTPKPIPTPAPTPKPANTFRGVILDDDGQPVGGALVRTVSGAQHQAERSAVSGANGKFSIKDIPDESLDKVIVEARGFSTRVLEDIPLPLPDEIQIGMNPLTGIDALVFDFATTGSEPTLFSGQMKASLMQLKVGGGVSTDSLGISEPVLPVDTFVPVRNQDVVVTHGELRFDNVEPGRYRIAVKDGKKVAESSAIDVVDGSRTSATLVLGMKHTVKGNVVAADTEQSLAQARITLSSAGQPSAAPEFPDYLSFTDGGGEFVIPEVQPGHYWMVVGANGYTTKTLVNFEVLPGAPPEDTSVTLTKQEPLITVSVTNAEGRPMVNAPLVLMSTSVPTPRMYFGKTDEAGLHRFDHLLAGRYSLSITAPGDPSSQRTVNVELGEGTVLELPVRFAKPVSVTGKATMNGDPYKGLLSFVLGGGAIADNLVTADKSGEFTTDLEPGSYMVGTPDKPGGALVTIKNAEVQTVRIKLTK